MLPLHHAPSERVLLYIVVLNLSSTNFIKKHTFEHFTEIRIKPTSQRVLFRSQSFFYFWAKKINPAISGGAARYLISVPAIPVRINVLHGGIVTGVVAAITAHAPTHPSITGVRSTTVTASASTLTVFVLHLILLFRFLHRIIGRGRLERMVQLVRLLDVFLSHPIEVAGILLVEFLELFTHCFLKVFIMLHCCVLLPIKQFSSRSVSHDVSR